MNNPILIFASLLSLLLIGLLAFVMIVGPEQFPMLGGGDNPQSTMTQQETEQFNAAHILIAYKGSSKSKATRSKEEAKALAEEVAEKVKADGSNFAELAAKHSDGPSGRRGGNLGNFPFNKMAKPFSQATAELEIGGISKPVETIFGYHIILRKEPN